MLAAPRLQTPINNPALFPWHEVTKVKHCWLAVEALTQPIQVREEALRYGKNTDGGETNA